MDMGYLATVEELTIKFRIIITKVDQPLCETFLIQYYHQYTNNYRSETYVYYVQKSNRMSQMEVKVNTLRT